MSGVPVFASGALVFAADAQGISLDCLTLVGAGDDVPRSHRIVTIREGVLGRLPSPGHCTDSGLKHSPSLSVKEAYLLVLELWPQGQASGMKHVQRLQRCSQGM